MMYSPSAVVFQNYRDYKGHITGQTTDHPLEIRTDIFVPSLGAVVDNFVDRFGYETKFIHKLYNAMERSANSHDFVGRTNRWLPEQEALWFYSEITRFPGNRAAPTRRRRYVPE